MELSRRQFVLASAALVASCSSDRGDSTRTEFVDDGTTERLDINGQRGLLMMPAKQNGHAIVYHHGAGEDETAPTADALKAELVRSLLDAGFVIASCAAHGDNWGNQPSLADYSLLINKLGAYEKVVHWSQSMGGLSGLEVVASGMRCDGWFGIYPACDVLAMFDLNMFAPAILEAYAVTSREQLAEVATTDPVKQRADQFAGVRMRFYASAADTVVPKSPNTDVMAALVAPAVPEADVVLCAGNHADPSHFQPADVLAFLGRCVA
jgi:hypothetical protein